MNIEKVRLAIESLIEIVERADTSEGVCCCGDDMTNHPNPMHCGHSPVDAGDYHATGCVKRAREVLSGLHELRPSDGVINEITMRVLGKWPSFEAQSWACKVVHAVLDQGRATVNDECAATGEGCAYGAHGPNGERQCRYCGEAPGVPAQSQLPISADDLSESERGVYEEGFKAGAAQADADLRLLVRERARADRLQRILDSRPAINAGLPGTYIEWTQAVYAMEIAHASETAQ